ncbi:Tfp pilus assembly protein PilF [Rhodobacteraceae bacterium MBR-64]|jgi:Tfp pilus assembly protein PilF
MHQPLGILLCLCGAVVLSGCAQDKGAEAARALASVNVIDESNLNDIMLTVADPNEAVNYFRRATGDHPERMDLQRGLAQSLIRAKRPVEAIGVWETILADAGATNDDRVNFADALIRANQWDRAASVLNSVPPTHETFQRYRLEAMVADSKKQWKKADSFYETAVGMTTRPASVLNNWGYSKLTRGDARGSERLFIEALQYDSGLFTAKNNLTLARAAQRKYDLPVIEMTQPERAQLLYTLALSAIKQGDVAIGKGLLQDAIDTSPQYFEAAERSLRTLEAVATN